MRHLRFIDPCAPRAYADLADLTGLGGTEATLLRVVEGLARKFLVTVEQAARTYVETYADVQFAPMDLARQSGDVIIVINSWKVALICRKHNPLARIFVWQHVFPGKHNRPMVKDLANAGIELVCVSSSHAAFLSKFLSHLLPVRYIYNPVADDLHPDATSRDQNLLLFASSPHKGLDQVAAAFQRLHSIIPDLRLELADPGYLAWDNGPLPDGVVVLGTLTHWQVIAKMRQALCLFYPQTKFAETFGLVIAEANAVGCPALVHSGLGANNEVTANHGQRIDASNPALILDRVKQWQNTPPAITLQQKFRLSAVIEQWHQFLAGDKERGSASTFMEGMDSDIAAKILEHAR